MQIQNLAPNVSEERLESQTSVVMLLGTKTRRGWKVQGERGPEGH